MRQPSQVLAALPAEPEAARVLSETFSDHSAVNVSRRLCSGGVVTPPATAAGGAYVIAEIIVLPDLAPVPPGGEFPDVTEQVVGHPVLVHAAAWPHEPGSDAERHTAGHLLQHIVSGLPGSLWREDG